MPKNRFSTNPKQQTPVMSPSHTHTVGVVANQLSTEEDADDDICPVCDGECTCDHKPRLPLPSPNVSSTPSRSFTTNASMAAQPLPSLKIRLTVPPRMIGKLRVSGLSSSKGSSKSTQGTTSASAQDGEGSSNSATPNYEQHSALKSPFPPPAKRRGRPPKAIVAARTALKVRDSSDQHVLAPVPGPSQLQFSRSQKCRGKLPDSSGLQKSAQHADTRLPAPPSKTKSRPIIANTSRRATLSEPSESDLTDIEEQDDSDDDDTRSLQFPTFVSASAISGSSSSEDSDSGPASDFDSDSSIEAEEENFILSEDKRARDKARVRRELLGDDEKRRDPYNNWVIRPRKSSVGPEDADMDVESDGNSADDDEDDEATDPDEDETDEKDPGVRYAGVATGWSDEEESSFDADLFFANLSDTSGDDQSNSGDETSDNGGDGDQSDLDSTSAAGGAGELMSPFRLAAPNLPFEVTQGWDGQIVFTNGPRDRPSVLDIDFEVNAAQLLIGSSACPNQDSDVDMVTSDAEKEVSDGNDEMHLDETDGETTEDELVGHDGRPTERALRLFRFPSSVSAIDPLSTVSPTVSPAPYRRRRLASNDTPQSPKPADILAGRVFRHEDDPQSRVTSPSSVSSRGYPSMGQFFPSDGSPQKRAIITGMNKDVPSPFPRSRRSGRSLTSSMTSSSGSLAGIAHLLRGRMPTRGGLSLPGSSRSSMQIHSPDEFAMSSSPGLPPTEPIDLDDVLDSSFLELGPSETQSSFSNEGDAQRRWEHMSVGGLRSLHDANLEHESPAAGWAANTPRAGPSDEFTYDNMMKSSPLSTMLWPSKNAKKKRSKARNMSVAISPVILPVRDGDNAMTHTPPYELPPPPPKQTHHRSRKESRRDKKMKKKSCGLVHHQHQHHHHYHHPNLKSRGSNSVQRTNFFSAISSVPPLNL